MWFWFKKQEQAACGLLVQISCTISAKNQNSRMKSATNMQIKHESEMLWPPFLLFTLHFVKSKAVIFLKKGHDVAR